MTVRQHSEHHVTCAVTISRCTPAVTAGRAARMTWWDRDVLQNAAPSNVHAPSSCSISPIQTEAVDEIRRFQDEGGLVVAYGMGDAAHFPDCDRVVFDIADRLGAGGALLTWPRDIVPLVFLPSWPTTSRETPRFPIRHPRTGGAQSWTCPPEWVFFGDIYEANGARLAETYRKLKHRPTAPHCGQRHFGSHLRAPNAAPGLRGAGRRFPWWAQGPMCPRARFNLPGTDYHRLSNRWSPSPRACATCCANRLEDRYDGPPPLREAARRV